MKKILLLMVLCSCSNNNLDSGNLNLNFDKYLTFDEFKAYIDKYNELSPYPDLK